MAIYNKQGAVLQVVGETQPRKMFRSGRMVKTSFVVCKLPNARQMHSYEWDELKADGGEKEIRETLNKIQATKD